MRIKGKNFYTITELAKVLQISRVSVFKRVRSGSIKAQKMGYNFIIFKKDLNLRKLMATIKR